MRFFSKPSSLRVQIVKGGWRPNPDHPDMREFVDGEYVQFEKGQYDTVRYAGELAPADVIERLRRHPSYGYPKSSNPNHRQGFDPNLFWCELDRPESLRVEEEMAMLRAEVEAYRKLAGPQKVVVELKTAPPAEPTKAAEVPVVPEGAKNEEGADRLPFNDLKRRVKELGIAAELTWKREDYERALAEKEG